MSKKKTNPISSFFCLVLGIIIGFCGITYLKLPTTDSVAVSEEIFYSKSDIELSTVIPVDEANLSVHFIELGNKYTGDCTYIKTDTCDILIDCGSKSNSIPYVVEYLNKYVTDNTLEYVIITHAHQDHYAGFATNENVDSIFDIFECNNIITFSNTNQSEDSKTYSNYKRELQDEINNGAIHYKAIDCAGEEFNIGTNTKMKVLNSYYYDPANHSSSENNYSVCTLFSYKQSPTKTINMLFTGDLEEDGEEYLISKNSLPQVDLYKAGHHGSKTSSSEELLQTIQPSIVCVCCCAGSPEYANEPKNQFPTQDFINRVAPYTDKIYVTTLCVNYKNNEFTSFNGNIVFLCDNTTCTISCSNNNTILKESDWFKQNRTWPQVNPKKLWIKNSYYIKFLYFLICSLTNSSINTYNYSQVF